jgi:hypothetical protein
MLQQLRTKTFSPKAYATMQCHGKQRHQNPLKLFCTGTYPSIQIKWLLPYLGTYVQQYTVKEMSKIIVKSLSPKAMQKYVGDGGDNLKDYSNIFELMSMIDTKLQLKQETAALKQQKNMKSNQQPNKGKPNNGNKSKGGSKNPCQMHNSAHEWKDCPNNKTNKPKSESAKGKKSMKMDLHSTKAINTTTKKTPMVHINEEPEVVEQSDNPYTDLDHSSDDAWFKIQKATR